MKKEISVSVAMITYNHEQYLKEAIEGVLKQKANFSIEFIIANDNSPDNSDTIIKDYLSDLPKNIEIRYIKHKINKGIMGNFIWVLEQCQSKYIALCEGDDYWTDPYKLQKQVDFLEKNEDYTIVGHKSMIDHFGERIEKRNYNVKNPILIKDWIGKMPFFTSAFLFKKNDLDLQLMKQFNKFISGDRIVITLLLMKGNGYLIDEYMSVYRHHKGGISQTENIIKIKKNEILLYKELNKITLKKYKNTVYNSVLFNHSIILKQLFKESNYLRYFIYLFIITKDIKNISTLKFYLKNIIFRCK